MNSTNNPHGLSIFAHLLYNILKQHGATHEYNCAHIMFNCPKFAYNEKEYWQWQANLTGKKQDLEGYGIFLPKVETSYMDEVSKAYKELREKKLADERNNGYNSYTFYLAE